MSWRSLPRISEIAAFVLMELSAISILASMFLGTSDVVGSRFFRAPVPGAKEGTETLMVLVVFGTLAYAELKQSHIRVLVLYERLSPRAKSVCDLLSSCIALLFFGLLTWQAVDLAWDSWLMREYVIAFRIRFPIYPAKAALLIGVAAMVVQLMVFTARRSLVGIVSGIREAK